ncbi:MAG TPA: hypothetical protein VMQ86_14465 [Bryobacteraceae bacterium]|nr:hypothetical protein [Bryobacteraceae bacterium]
MQDWLGYPLGRLSLRPLFNPFMNYSLKQVIQLELHDRDLLFERSEPARQAGVNGMRTQTFQNLGSRKVGEVTRARLVAGFLKRPVLLLAEPEYDNPVSRLAGHGKMGFRLAASGFYPHRIKGEALRR